MRWAAEDPWRLAAIKFPVGVGTIWALREVEARGHKTFARIARLVIVAGMGAVVVNNYRIGSGR